MVDREVEWNGPARSRLGDRDRVIDGGGYQEEREREERWR
jgi:hypothetical protein